MFPLQASDLSKIDMERLRATPPTAIATTTSAFNTSDDIQPVAPAPAAVRQGQGQARSVYGAATPPSSATRSAHTVIEMERIDTGNQPELTAAEQEHAQLREEAHRIARIDVRETIRLEEAAQQQRRRAITGTITAGAMFPGVGTGLALAFTLPYQIYDAAKVCADYIIQPQPVEGSSSVRCGGGDDISDNPETFTPPTYPVCTPEYYECAGSLKGKKIGVGIGLFLVTTITLPLMAYGATKVVMASINKFNTMRTARTDTQTPEARETRQIHERAEHYIANPDELAIRVEQENNIERNDAERNIVRSQYPTFAYQAGPTTDAREIRHNITNALRRRPSGQHFSESVVRDRINAMVEQITQAQEGGGSSSSTPLPLNRTRLDGMLDTNMEEIALCWNYINYSQTESGQIEQEQTDFIKYLANSEGCRYGRDAQVLLYFQGKDDNIAPIRDVSKVTKVPDTGSMAHKELCGQISSAFNYEMTEGTLEVDTPKKNVHKCLLNLFTKNKKNGNGTSFQQMTPDVYTSLFNTVWDQVNPV